MLRSTLIIVNIVAVAFVAGLAVAAWVAKNRRKDVPPNIGKFYDDETLEGPRLEKILGMALVFSAAVALLLPLYWLLVPTEVHGAFEEQFEEQSIARGEERFTTLGCSGCHGETGGGGVAPVVLFASDGTPFPGQHIAPALNTVLKRFSETEVFGIVTYGRPGTPMAGWGIAGNGALNDQTIQDLVNYIGYLQITDDEAVEVSEADLVDAQATAVSRGRDVSDGQLLFEINCARCHTQGFSTYESYFQDATLDPPPELVMGGGAFGPNLTQCSTVRQFPLAADMIEFITLGSDLQRGYGQRGIGSGRMPGFGVMLTDEQIAAIVEYERSLGLADGQDCDDVTAAAAAEADEVGSDPATTSDGDADTGADAADDPDAGDDAGADTGDDSGVTGADDGASDPAADDEGTHAVTSLLSLLATTEVKDAGWWGYLVVLCAVVLFCGSVYLLLYTNLGNNIALMLSVAAVTGFVMLLSFSWMTQQFPNGPLGRAAVWEVDDMVAQDTVDFAVASQSLARDMDPVADSDDEAGSQISPDLEAALAADDTEFTFFRSPRPYPDSLTPLTAEDLCTLRADLEGVEGITSVDACADVAASILAADAAAEEAASEPVAEGETAPAPAALPLAVVLDEVDAPELDGLRSALEGVDLDSLTDQAQALVDLAEVTRAIGLSDTEAAEAAAEAGEVVDPVADPVNQRSAESLYRISTLTEGQRARIDEAAPGALDAIPLADADGLQALADELVAATSALSALEGDAALADDVQAGVDASFEAVTAILPEHETGEVQIAVDASNDFIIQNTWDTGGDRKMPVWFSKTLHVAAVHFCLTDQRALELTPFGSPPVRVCEPLAENQTAFVHLDLGARRIKATYTFFGSAILFGVSIAALYLYETAGQPRRRRFGKGGGGGGGGGGPEGPAPSSPAPEREKELVG